MSSSAEYSSLFSLPIAALQYRDIAAGPILQQLSADDAYQALPQESARPRADYEFSEAEFAARVRQERIEAAQQVEQKLRQEYEQKLLAGRAPIAAALKEFAEQKDHYFARVETEVVQLALSIAAKILHREAQVDPMLVASLVRIAIEKMRDDSRATVRVSPSRASSWKRYFEAHPVNARIEVTEDPTLTELDCILETQLGSANFGLDAQLKEVEQGFFDLLALRPGR
jgi:flagellar assembly protein FliH